MRRMAIAANVLLVVYHLWRTSRKRDDVFTAVDRMAARYAFPRDKVDCLVDKVGIGEAERRLYHAARSNVDPFHPF